MYGGLSSAFVPENQTLQHVAGGQGVDINVLSDDSTHALCVLRLLSGALDGFDDEGSAPAGLGGGLGLPPQASQAAKGGGAASAGKADSEADAAASAAAAVAAASSEAARPAAGAAGGADDAQLDELAKGLEALFGQVRTRRRSALVSFFTLARQSLFVCQALCDYHSSSISSLWSTPARRQP